MKSSYKITFLGFLAILTLGACSGGNNTTTTFSDATPNSIYGKISEFNLDKETCKAGDVLTFKVTPSEDFFIESVTNNNTPCTMVKSNDDGSAIYSTTLGNGKNKIKASYMVDASVDFVSKFKLNISDEVFAEVMNPQTFTADKKLGLDFRRSGIEQVNAPNKWSGGSKSADSNTFINYVDGDTTHVEAKNLGYTIKIRYLGIDTPESTSEIEEWGLTASYYNKYVYSGDTSYLSYIDCIPEYAGATSIILVGQSASLNAAKMTLADLKLGSNEQGTYFATADGNQRSLAYVWYSTVENPTKNDFRCLNLEMVYQGFSFGVGSIEDTGEYFYKFFDKANLSAKANRRHLYAEGVEDANYYYYERDGVQSISLERLYNSGENKDSELKYYPTSPFCNKKTLFKVEGYVSRKVGTSFYIQDKPEYSEEYLKTNDPYGLYVFTYAETPIKTGDYVSVVGAISSYGGCYQMQGISFHTLHPDPIRDTQIISSGHNIVPIKITGAELNSKCYPQVLVEVTDDVFCYNFTSVYGDEVSDLGEGGLQEVNKYNEAYPFYNNSNAPIFYGGYGVDNCEEMDSNPSGYGGSKSTGLRYSKNVIRFTVDQEILVTFGIYTCYSYRFFTGGSYCYNTKGAEYANMDNDNPYKSDTLTYTFKRKKMTKCVVISSAYESTSGRKKMTAKICSGTDLTLEEID